MNPPDKVTHHIVKVRPDGTTEDLGHTEGPGEAIKAALASGKDTGIIRPARQFMAEIAEAHGVQAAYRMLSKAMAECKVLPTMILVNGRPTAAVALTPAFLQEVADAANQEEGE